nr:hypothetical protein HmN_000324900 [Hymenolepis microstoma]
MQIDAELTQKNHHRFNECFRNILSFLIFSGFSSIIGLITSIVITVNSFRYKAEIQFTVASFLIILCTGLASASVYFIYVHVKRIQKIHEAQLISLVQLEANQNVRQTGSTGGSQTIVFLDPTMFGGTANTGITPPPYSSVADHEQHQESQPSVEN